MIFDSVRIQILNSCGVVVTTLVHDAACFVHTPALFCASFDAGSAA